MDRLTLQLHHQGKWHDALTLVFAYPDDAYERLRQDARQLSALPDILASLGLSDAVMNHPSIALGKLERRLVQWGLA